MKLLIDTKDYTAYAELLEACIDRQRGYQGRNARDVLADMERIVSGTQAGSSSEYLSI